MDRVGTFLFERLIAVDAEKIATRFDTDYRTKGKKAIRGKNMRIRREEF